MRLLIRPLLYTIHIALPLRMGKSVYILGYPHLEVTSTGFTCFYLCVRSPFLKIPIPLFLEARMLITVDCLFRRTPKLAVLSLEPPLTQSIRTSWRFGCSFCLTIPAPLSCWTASTLWCWAWSRHSTSTHTKSPPWFTTRTKRMSGRGIGWELPC